MKRRASRTWLPYCHSCPSLHKGVEGSVRSMSVAEAMKAGFLPALHKDQPLDDVHPVGPGVAPVQTR